jgi:hypothetical protein
MVPRLLEPLEEGAVGEKAPSPL